MQQQFKRAYGSLDISLPKRVLETLAIFFLIEMVFLTFFQDILDFSQEYTFFLLNYWGVISENSCNIESASCFLWRVVTLDAVIPEPSFYLTLFFLFLGSAFIFCVWYFERYSGADILLSVLGFILVVSGLYFIIAPEYFPYTLKDFSKVFNDNQVTVWLGLVPFLSLITSTLPYTFIFRLILTVSAIITVILLKFIFYFLSIILVLLGSALFMPLLFFLFGPLLDIYAVVLVYSFFIFTTTRNERKALTQEEDFAWN